VIPSFLQMVAVISVIAAVWLTMERSYGWAFMATCATLASSVLALFADLYPRLMVSSTNTQYNLTVSNSASGSYALKVMTVVVVFILPVVLVYQAWSYHVFRARVHFEEPAVPVATVTE
jgi:cytochrome bd ubiquinol oxidase subunit II